MCFLFLVDKVPLFRGALSFEPERESGSGVPFLLRYLVTTQTETAGILKVEKANSQKNLANFPVPLHTQTMIIVLATPRSRTAWLTAFLNTAPQTLVLHDQSAECDHIDQIPQADVIIDTLFALKPKQIRAHYPDAQIVTLVREPEQVHSSIIKWSKQEIPPSFTKQVYDDIKCQDSVLQMSFDTLDDQLPQLWALITDAPFPRRTHEQFKKLNIQRPCNSYDMDDPEKAARFLRSLD